MGYRLKPPPRDTDRYEKWAGDVWGKTENTLCPPTLHPPNNQPVESPVCLPGQNSTGHFRKHMPPHPQKVAQLSSIEPIRQNMPLYTCLKNWPKTLTPRFRAPTELRSVGAIICVTSKELART